MKARRVGGSPCVEVASLTTYNPSSGRRTLAVFRSAEPAARPTELPAPPIRAGRRAESTDRDETASRPLLHDRPKVRDGGHGAAALRLPGDAPGRQPADLPGA